MWLLEGIAFFFIGLIPGIFYYILGWTRWGPGWLFDGIKEWRKERAATKDNQRP